MSLDTLRHSYVDAESIDDMSIDELKDEVQHLHSLLAQQKTTFQVTTKFSNTRSETAHLFLVYFVQSDWFCRT